MKVCKNCENLSIIKEEHGYFCDICDCKEYKEVKDAK